jgi:hypothetical protein
MPRLPWLSIALSYRGVIASLAVITFVNRKRLVLIAAAMIGAAMGLFWLVAVDAGVNGAEWAPNWRRWYALAMCPFIPLIGTYELGTALVPILNSLLYAMIAFTCLKFRSRAETSH